MTFFRLSNRPLSKTLRLLGIATLGGWSLLLQAQDAEPTDEPPPYTGDSAEAWIERYGEVWFDHFGDSYESWYPGGRSNEFHDQWIRKMLYEDPRTTDWTIFNQQYVFDGQWYAVEWFYQSTYTDTSFQQWESTFCLGKIEDGKLVVWYEFFDDFGELQKLGLMPKFKKGEAIFPWPEDATLHLPYRP
ncbi:MAG: hypothetical protein ACFE0O_08185 [Opitutales bacterium]